jgi:hypothetical protein
MLMIRFEVKYLNKDNWEDVSEDTVLELIQENFVRVTSVCDIANYGTIFKKNRVTLYLLSGF